MITNWQVTVYMADEYVMDKFVIHNMSEKDAIKEVVEILDGDPDVDTFDCVEIFKDEQHV